MNFGLRLFRTLHVHFFIRAYRKLPSEVVMFMNDNMVVCWHPEQCFPYKCSKSLPVRQSQPESVLKIGETEVKAIFRKPRLELIPEELAKITYTTKHRWFPRARDKKAKNTTTDRAYL